MAYNSEDLSPSILQRGNACELPVSFIVLFHVDSRIQMSLMNKSYDMKCSSLCS